MYYASFGPVGGPTHSIAAKNELRERLAQALSLVECMEPQASPTEQVAGDPRPTEAQVRQVIRTRRTRSQFFAAELFADPAWDILLDLYAASLGQRRVSVSDACLAAAVPASTGLRWITTLEKAGLVVRTNDPLDRRRVFVALSGHAMASMDAYFATTLTA